MPAKPGKLSVWVAVLNGPKVTSGGRDGIVSKFNLDILADWNEKDLQSVLRMAAGSVIPKGVSFDILKSDDGGKSVTVFKTGRGKSVDGDLVVSEKAKLLYLRPSRLIIKKAPEPQAKTSPRSKSVFAKDSNQEARRSLSAPENVETKSTRGRLAAIKSVSPSKSPAKANSDSPARSGRGRPPLKQSPKPCSQPQGTAKSPEKADEKPSRSHGRPVTINSEQAQNSPARNVKSPVKLDASPEKATRGRGRPPKSEKPVMSPEKAAESPEMLVRGRGRPAKIVHEDISPARVGKSPAMAGRSPAGAEEASPAPRGRGRPPKVGATQDARKSLSESRGRPAIKVDAKDRAASEGQKPGRGRPKKIADTDECDKKSARSSSQGSEGEKEFKGKRGRPPKIEKSDVQNPPRKALQSPNKAARSPPTKQVTTPRLPSAGRRNASPEALPEKRHRKAPKKFEDYTDDLNFKSLSNKQFETPKTTEKKGRGRPRKEVGDADKVMSQEGTLESSGDVKEADKNPRKRKSSTCDGEGSAKVQKADAEMETEEKKTPTKKKVVPLVVKMGFKGKDKGDASPEAAGCKVVPLSTPQSSPAKSPPAKSPPAMSPAASSSKAPVGADVSLLTPMGEQGSTKVILQVRPGEGDQNKTIRKIYVPSIEELMHGRRDVEPRNRPVTCLDCGEIVANRDLLYSHKSKCSSIGMHKVYACQDCPSSYYSRTDLMEHRRNEHACSNQSHMIERYGNQNLGNWDVKGHTVKATVPGNNGDDYNISICMACRAVFVNNTELEKHVKKMHPEMAGNQVEDEEDSSDETEHMKPASKKNTSKEKEDAEKGKESGKAKDAKKGKDTEKGKNIKDKESKKELNQGKIKYEEEEDETPVPRKRGRPRKTIVIEPREESPEEEYLSPSRKSGRKRKPSQMLKDYVSEGEMTTDWDQLKDEAADIDANKIRVKKSKRDEDVEGFLCEECDTACRSTKELEMHIMDVHRIQCQCGMKFGYRADLECHKIVACKAATWHCFECGKNLESRAAYNLHKTKCSNTDFKCPHCGVVSLSEKEHCKHSNKCFNRTTCKICNLFFTNEDVLERHVKKRHKMTLEEAQRSRKAVVLGTISPVATEKEDDNKSPAKSLARKSPRAKEVAAAVTAAESPRRATRSSSSSPQKPVGKKLTAKAEKDMESDEDIVNDENSTSKIVRNEEKANYVFKVMASKKKEGIKTSPVKESDKKELTKEIEKKELAKEIEKKQPARDAKKEECAKPAPVGTIKEAARTEIPTKVITLPSHVPSTSRVATPAVQTAKMSVKVTAAQLKELMAGGQEGLKKFLQERGMQLPQLGSQTPQAAVKPVTPAVKPEIKSVAVKPAVVTAGVKVEATASKAEGKEKAETKPSQMQFIVSASQLQQLMKGGTGNLEKFLATQIQTVQKAKSPPTSPVRTPEVKSPQKVMPVSPRQVVSPPKPPQGDPRLRKPIPHEIVRKPEHSYPRSQPPVKETPQSTYEETINIPVEKSSLNIPMSIIQNHIAEGHPPGTTKHLLVTTGDGVPYNVYVNANEDGSNISIQLEKYEGPVVVPPKTTSPPGKPRTIQVTNVSQPQPYTSALQQQLTTHALTQPKALSTTDTTQPAILRRKRPGAAEEASPPKVPKLKPESLGQYKIHCKDCQKLFDSYEVFTAHACVQRAQERKAAQLAANSVVQTMPEASTSSAKKQMTTSSSRKQTYYECSCCHQVFSSILLFNRHVCAEGGDADTKWKVQSLGSDKTGNSEDVEWLIAEAGDA